MLRFGPFALDPARRRVLRDGVAIAVRERAFEVLLALAEQPGRIVSKQRLCERGWPELADAENNLQVEISALRKRLGAGLIVTVPGRGYQLAMSADDDDLAAAQALAAPGTLVTITGEPGSGKTWLAAALAPLATVPLDDTADTAAAVHHAIARALGVDAAGAPGDIAAALNHRPGLLLLDGCDSASTAVADLLTGLIPRCPSTRFVVTSAEILRLPGERVIRLPPRDVDTPTKDAALTRSLSRLPGAERALVDTLAARPSPCRLDAIQVAPLQPWDVIEGLARLVDKSLVQVIAGEPPSYAVSGAVRRLARALR